MGACEQCGKMPETLINGLCGKCAYEKNPEMFRDPEKVNRSEENAAVCQCGNVTQEMKKGLCLECFEELEKDHAATEASETGRKPPLGIKPRFLIDEDREGEILSAVSRFHLHGRKVPAEWLEELHEIRARQAFRTAVKSISAELQVSTLQAKEIVRSAFERGVGCGKG